MILKTNAFHWIKITNKLCAQLNFILFNVNNCTLLQKQTYKFKWIYFQNNKCYTFFFIHFFVLFKRKKLYKFIGHNSRLVSSKNRTNHLKKKETLYNCRTDEWWDRNKRCRHATQKTVAMNEWMKKIGFIACNNKGRFVKLDVRKYAFHKQNRLEHMIALALMTHFFSRCYFNRSIIFSFDSLIVSFANDINCTTKYLNFSSFQARKKNWLKKKCRN